MVAPAAFVAAAFPMDGLAVFLAVSEAVAASQVAAALSPASAAAAAASTADVLAAAPDAYWQFLFFRDMLLCSRSCRLDSPPYA